MRTKRLAKVHKISEIQTLRPTFFTKTAFYSLTTAPFAEYLPIFGVGKNIKLY